MITNKKSNYFVWVEEEKKIIEVPCLIQGTQNHKIMQGKYCYSDEQDEGGFGIWRNYDPAVGCCVGWGVLPKEKVPKEFLTSLLLLGIQI